jgi:hypothetical protein
MKPWRTGWLFIVSIVARCLKTWNIKWAYFPDEAGSQSIAARDLIVFAQGPSLNELSPVIFIGYR